MFYFSRNGYNEVFIKFREQVENINSFPGEKVTIKQDFSKVFNYIEEAYGASRDNNLDDEIKEPLVSNENPIIENTITQKNIGNLNFKFLEITSTLVDLFNLVLKQENENLFYLFNSYENKSYLQIEKVNDGNIPIIKITCLDPHNLSIKKTFFEIDERTEINLIQQQLYDYIENSLGNNETLVKNDINLNHPTSISNSDIDEFNIVDSNISDFIVYHRKIYISNKFKKSIEKIQNQDRIRIFKILEEIEKAPKAPEFLNFIKKYNINKVHGFYKIRVDEAQRIAFTYFHQDGYSALKIIDFISDHEFDYLKEINLQNLTFHLWSSYNSEVSIKIPLLSDYQKGIVHDYNYPSIIFGAAGSGKTSISLEKYLSIQFELLQNNISTSHNHLLYLTFNSRMAEDIANQIRLFYPQANSMTIDEFFIDLIGDKTIKVQTYEDFSAWFDKTFVNAYDYKNRKIASSIDSENPSNLAYTYYRGVFKGSFGENFNRNIQSPNLDKKKLLDYLESEGISNETMESLWEVFIQYETYLRLNNLKHDNDIAFQLLNNIKEYEGKYLNLIIDETQDLTQVQIYVLLRLSKNYKIYFFGDSNQTINPTLFSLGMLNSTIYNLTNGKLGNINNHTLRKTYRSSKGLIEYTNKLVDLRKEWIASQGEEFDYYHETNEQDNDTRWAARVHNKNMIEKLIKKTLNNPNAIVLVPNNKVKTDLLNLFQMKDDFQNRIYNIFEAKGLEWESVLLYKFVGSEIPKFMDMIEGRASQSTIHRMIFNKYYVACTRARKTTLILEDFIHEGIKEKLFGSIHEITEEDILDAYFNNDNSPEAWIKEGNALFSQYEYRKAKISFEKAKALNENSVDEQIYICSNLDKFKQDKNFELSTDFIELLKEKRYFNHLINYYQYKNMRNYVKLIKSYQGELIPDQELKSLLLEINLDSKDEEFIRNTNLMKVIEKEEETNKKSILEVLK